MQPSREAEWCSLITATLPSWGPGGLIEFFTHPGKRRRGLPEDRQENMVLKTWLNNCLSVCLSERYQLVTDCLSASVTVSLHACRPHIWTEPTSEYFNSLPAWRAGAAVLSMSACLSAISAQQAEWGVRIIPETVSPCQGSKIQFLLKSSCFVLEELLMRLLMQVSNQFIAFKAFITLHFSSQNTADTPHCWGGNCTGKTQLSI